MYHYSGINTKHSFYDENHYKNVYGAVAVKNSSMSKGKESSKRSGDSSNKGTASSYKSG